MENETENLMNEIDKAIVNSCAWINKTIERDAKNEDVYSAINFVPDMLKATAELLGKRTEVKEKNCY